MAKLPSFQFYPGDWMKDPALRRCSAAARGVWMDVLCLMFESDVRGKLVTNGVTWALQDIARSVSGDTQENLSACQELLRNGVMKQDENGVFYCKRLVSDELSRTQTRERVRKLRSGNADVTHNVTPKYEDEDEDEVIDSKKEKPLTKDNLEDVYKAYPRKVGKGAAIKAIERSIQRLITGESPSLKTKDEAVLFLCQRVVKFARAPAGNAGEFTPHPATWFNQSRYLDDETEWSRGNSNETNQQTGTQSLGKQADRNEANRDAIIAGIFGGNAGGDAPHGGRAVENDGDSPGVGNVGAAGKGATAGSH